MIHLCFYLIDWLGARDEKNMVVHINETHTEADNTSVNDAMMMGYDGG